MMRLLAAAAATAMLACPALADDDDVRSPANAVHAAECGACHMAFPPSMLPARSWTAIMDGLADHFGEDAALDDGPAAEIRAYLVAHAADSVGATSLLRGVAETDVPLRITDMPWWIREHRGLRDRDFADPEVRTKSNCLACHRSAAFGEFDDD